MVRRDEDTLDPNKGFGKGRRRVHLGKSERRSKCNEVLQTRKMSIDRTIRLGTFIWFSESHLRGKRRVYLICIKEVLICIDFGFSLSCLYILRGTE